MPLGTQEGFLQYASSLGRAVAVDEAGAALRRGAAYLRGSYWKRLQGSPASVEELFPRRGVPGLASDVVPEAAKNAEYEAALIELDSPGALSTAYNPSVTREYVSGAVGTEYGDEGEQPERHLVIENLLAPFLLEETSVGMFFGSVGPRGLS